MFLDITGWHHLQVHSEFLGTLIWLLEPMKHSYIKEEISLILKKDRGIDITPARAPTPQFERLREFFNASSSLHA